MTKTKTNVYWNYGNQEAGLVKHKLHTMNSKGIWYNKNTRYKIHIIQYTVHNIRRRIKHSHLQIRQEKNRQGRPKRRDLLTGAVVFVVIDKLGNCCKCMLLSKVVETFSILTYVIMLHYSRLHTASQ